MDVGPVKTHMFSGYGVIERAYKRPFRGIVQPKLNFTHFLLTTMSVEAPERSCGPETVTRASIHIVASTQNG